MKKNYNSISIEDEENGKVVIKLNDFDITRGITKYSILRTAEKNETVILNLEMVVIPEKICIQKSQD